MKRNHSALKMLLVKLCCCLCLSAAVVGCGNNANVRSTDNRSTSPTGETRDDSGATSQPTSDDAGASPSQQTTGSKAEEVCRKYELCGCQRFDECMAQISRDPAIERPGIGDCMLKSSCQSLCAGQPDGCPKTNTGAGNPAPGSQRSNCATISCTRSSDCPSDCYGGCDGVICYSF